MDLVNLQHALEMLLEVKYGLQSLGSAVANRVALRWGAKRSSTLSLMSIVLSIVHSVTPDLSLIQPFQSFHAALAVWLFHPSSMNLK